jgi:peptidyl-prolyl cis-trans isomerase C
VERAYNEARVAYKEDAEWREGLKKEGFTPEGFREELRSKQTVSLLLSQEAQKVPEPSEAELREYYTKNAKDLGGERLKVANILIRVPEGSKLQQLVARRARAEELRRRVQEGGDFAALARKHSEDTATKDRGGVMEPFGRGEIMKPVEEAAFALQPGEVSDVVETQYGYHILKLLEKIPGEPPQFEEIKDRLRPHLATARRQEHVQSLVNRLRARARIETFL